jgi:RNA polymerase sigma-70 factor (ECF subfamily)
VKICKLCSKEFIFHENIDTLLPVFIPGRGSEFPSVSMFVPVSSPTDDLDQELIARIRAGDEDAARQLYDRYVNRLTGLIRAKTGSKHRALISFEDVAQSVFRSVFRGVKSGDYDAPPGESLWSLLAIIAVRKLSRERRYHDAHRRDATQTVPLDSQRELATDDQSYVARQLELTVQDLLDGMKEIDQRIFRLRIEGFEVEEIASKVSFSKRSVERSLQNSRKALVKLLQDESGDLGKAES